MQEGQVCTIWAVQRVDFSAETGRLQVVRARGWTVSCRRFKGVPPLATTGVCGWGLRRTYGPPPFVCPGGGTLAAAVLFRSGAVESGWPPTVVPRLKVIRRKGFDCVGTVPPKRVCTASLAASFVVSRSAKEKSPVPQGSGNQRLQQDAAATRSGGARRRGLLWQRRSHGLRRPPTVATAAPTGGRHRDLSRPSTRAYR